MLRKSVSRTTTMAFALSAGLLWTGCEVDQGETALDGSVRTLNENYDRTTSRVLVRQVKSPTRANLDYAAYHNNVILFDSANIDLSLDEKVTLDQLTFGGTLQDVKISLDGTPLTESERNQPLAWAPLLDYLLNWDFEKGAEIANAYAAVPEERWGDEDSDVNQPFQELATAWIHTKGNNKEIWVELEFKPWMKSNVAGITDVDRDHYPEVYARFNPEAFPMEAIKHLQGDYMSKPLNESQATDWANTLAAYWYPTYNTDVLDLTNSGEWPFSDTEADIKKELQGLVVKNPLSIFRGRPFNVPIYQIFVVDDMGERSGPRTEVTASAADKKLDPNLSQNLESIQNKLQSELNDFGGGTWAKWNENLLPFHQAIDKFAATQPADVMGLVGEKGFLVFRRELDFLKTGDLSAMPEDKNPIPAIVAFKNKMIARGVDFLFVPIPTKQDVYPEIIPGAQSELPGNIAQPHARKLLLDLAKQGVESVDILTPFLEAKQSSADGKRLLYQFQDTHWTTDGLELAANVLASRIKGYEWYEEAFKELVQYGIQDTSFSNPGDIYGRLPVDLKTQFRPDTLEAKRIVLPDGSFYEDQEGSAVLIIGDSYTGVYHKVGPKHAGVSAHTAKNLGGPVDLIMGWGGGPEAPDKLERRGENYLDNKRLVVWMMSARDLFAYSGTWAVETQTAAK